MDETENCENDVDDNKNESNEFGALKYRNMPFILSPKINQIIFNNLNKMNTKILDLIKNKNRDPELGKWKNLNEHDPFGDYRGGQRIGMFIKTLLENFNKENILSIFVPNSYEVFWDIEPDQFRDKMFLEYEKFWNKSRTEKAKNIGLTKKEVIALASIVQKESVKVDERPIIAGVYVNRLNTRMRLQADPTVIYSIKDYYKN